MSARTFVAVAVAGVLLVAPAVASAHQGPSIEQGNEVIAQSVLIPVIPRIQPDVRPAVEQIVVTFMNPVLVGDRILMGKYVIEHDNRRMARGRPCTHIYAYDQRLPVVAFHCTHLNRPRSNGPTVTLMSMDEPNGLKRLREFQFNGEAAAHGVPTHR